MLVRDGEIVMDASNRTRTDDDLALHPELTLARRAASDLSPGECVETVMYTSAEPCSMCATGMVYPGLGAVAYSVSGALAAAVSGQESDGIPCDEVVERHRGDMTVRGPVPEAEGLAIHCQFRE